jgi:hypothetical protein
LVTSKYIYVCFPLGNGIPRGKMREASHFYLCTFVLFDFLFFAKGMHVLKSKVLSKWKISVLAQIFFVG